MRGTQSAGAETFPSADALPGDAASLFETADSFFSTKAWWRTIGAHATPDAAEPCFVLCRIDGTAAGVFPLLRLPSDVWRSFTTPYTCSYTPLIAAPDVIETFGRFCRTKGVVRLDALPAEWPHLGSFSDRLGRVGLVVRRFDHFGNWYEDVAGLDWARYLAGRPGALRETIRRRLRRAERLDGATFTLVDDSTGLDGGINAFETVYRRSWKEPEPFPTFNGALIRAAAALGLLRLGVWSIGAVPVAAQYWIVDRGRATVMKLAHDEAYKGHSPGTVLTALMIRHLLDHDHVTEIDFGRGDDPYKRDWAQCRRQRVGLLILRARHPRGLLALLRHDLGRLWRRWRSAEAA